MTNVYAQSHHLAPTDAPIEAMQHAVKAMTTAMNERVDDIGRQYREMAVIEEVCRRRLQQLIGDDGYKRLRALHKRLYERPAILPKQPESPTEVLARRDNDKRRKHELLMELKVSPEDVRSLYREMRKKIVGSIPPPPSRDGQILSLLRPFDLPSEIREGKANPWTIARAPYSDWSWYYTGWTNGFGFTPTLYLDQMSGQVGSSNCLLDNNASDFDYAQIEYNASIGFWYQMPVNGRLDIYVEAQADVTTHQLTIIDEWGESDAFSWQENYLVVKADGLAQDPWQKAMTSWFKYDNDNEGSWIYDNIHHDTTWWAHLQTQNWFPKDSWVHINAGSTSWHRAFANDMQVYSDMRFLWFIRSVWVEPSG
jgi:hypothetical protein